RRHTRFSRDWSSDVCSSDLHAATEEREAELRRLYASPRKSHGRPALPPPGGPARPVIEPHGAHDAPEKKDGPRWARQKSRAAPSHASRRTATPSSPPRA